MIRRRDIVIPRATTPAWLLSESVSFEDTRMETSKVIVWCNNESRIIYQRKKRF